MEFEIVDSFPEAARGRPGIADWEKMAEELNSGRIVLISAEQMGRRSTNSLRQAIRSNMTSRGIVVETTHNDKGVWARKQKPGDGGM